MGARRRVEAAAVAVMVGILGAMLPLAAQERHQGREPTRSCRCVDDEGREIEDCVCVDMGRARAPFEALGRFGRRGRLGVTVAETQGSEWDARGVRVRDVAEGGPAARAGLREGDAIVGVDGRSVLEPLAGGEDTLDRDRSLPVQRFLRLLRDVEPGDTVRVEYRRDDRTRTADVVADRLPLGWSFVGPGNPEASVVHLGPGTFDSLPLPGDPDARRGFRGLVLPRGPDSLAGFRLRRLAGDPCLQVSDGARILFGEGCVDGLEMRELEPELGRYFQTERGVLVLDVRETSDLPLQPGDVILAVGGREVDDPEDVARILRSYAPDEDVTLRIVRKGATMEVTGRRR